MVERDARIAFPQELRHRRPRIPALHEPGHEYDCGGRLVVVHRGMIPINRTYAPLQAFVDELARCGLEQAVTCPGSRNAPLVLTLAGDERIHCVSMLDER